MSDKPTYEELLNRVHELEQKIETIEKDRNISSARDLLKNESLFKGFFDNMISGSSIYEVQNDGSKGSDYIIRGFNKTSLKIEGKTIDQVLGKSLFDLRPTIDEYGLIPVMKEVWETGIPSHFPSKIYVDDSFSNYYENHIFRLPSGEVVTIYNDVADLKNAGTELRESEEKYRNLFKSIGQGVGVCEVVTDKNGEPIDYIFLDINDKYTEITSLTREMCIGKKSTQIDPNTEKYWIEKLGNVALTGKPVYFEGKWDKINKYYAINAYSQKKGQFVVLVTDITEKKKAEQEAIENNEKYISIFETAANLITSVDNEGIIRECNERIEEVLGYKKEEIIGQNMFKIIHPDYHQKAVELLNEILETGYSSNKEYVFVRKDGKHRNIKINSSGLKGGNGNYYRTICILEDITEKRKTEELLKNNEERLSLLFENLSDLILIVDKDGINIWNSTSVGQYGLEQEGSYGISAFDYVHPEDVEQVRTVFQKAIDNPGELFVSNHRSTPTPDNPQIWYYQMVTFRYLPDHPLINGVIAICHDETENKIAEQELKIFADRLRISTESAGIGIWDLDLKNNVLIWDEKMLELYGVDPEHFKGAYEAWKEGVHPDDLIRCEKEVQDAIAGIKDYHTQFRIVWSNGGIRHIEAHAIVLKDSAGKPDRMIGVNSDITHRKKANEKLRNSEASLKKAQAIGQIGSWEFDIQQNRITWSDEMYRIFGLKPQEKQITTEQLQDFIHPDFQEYHLALGDKMDKQGKFEYEYQMVRPNGEIRWISGQVETVCNEDGKPEKRHGIAQDITDRKNAEEEKRRLEDQLLQAQKMESIGRLAGGVAHDYNNISSIIIGYSELALEQIKPEDPLHEDLEEILTAAKRSTDITRQLLAFARKQTIAPKVLDLNDTIENMLKMLRRLIGEDIDLVWLPGAEVWPVEIDPSQVDQIVANLGVNARDAVFVNKVVA